MEMWWLIGSAPDFCGGGPGFESGISHNDPWGAAGSLSNTVKTQGRGWNLHLRPKINNTKLKPDMVRPSLLNNPF